MSNTFSTPQLKQRGWTLTMIRTFLPVPDEKIPNPKYCNAGSPMKLYVCKRVEKIEKTKKFLKHKEAADQRKQSAAKAVETKQAKMAQFVDEFQPKIPEYDREELLERADCNFYSLDFANRVYISDERKCVNYLRHCETAYEQKLWEIFGKTGVRAAYLDIKEKILEAIALTYDWLADECDLQMHRAREKFLSEP